LGLSSIRESTVTEDEIKSLIAEGTRTGVFVPQEKEMIEGVLRLADRPVRVILTPRSEIVWIDIKADLREIVDKVESNRTSRLLVCEGTVDHPVGVVHTKDLLPAALRSGEVRLEQALAPLLFVPDRTPVLKLLNRFKKEKVHIAVVVNEYGTTKGIVTLTDVIEAIAGDLPERGEDDEPRVVKREEGSWLVDGMLPTDEVASIAGIDMGDDVMMMAGFMLGHLGRIPETGASFEHAGARFEVVDMDGNRIDKILIEIVPSEPEASGLAGEADTPVTDSNERAVAPAEDRLHQEP
jgi:putative hemolysin